MTGTLYGVGVGPGAPDLLTLRALRIIQAAPVICVPRRTTSAESYALSIVRDILVPARQELIELLFPMSRDPDTAARARDDAAARVHAILVGGRDVAFITEGDPLLYSTFIHLYERLRAVQPAAPVEIVPGVTSVTAAAAVAGLPLVDGSEQLAIVPATGDPNSLRDVLRVFDTVALLKVSPVFDRVLDLLDELDLIENTVHITQAGTPTQQIERDVRALRGRQVDYLSLLLVRKTRRT